MNEWYLARLNSDGEQIGEYVGAVSATCTDVTNENAAWSAVVPLNKKVIDTLTLFSTSEATTIIGMFVHFDGGFELVGGGYLNRVVPNFNQRTIEISGDGFLKPLGDTIITDGELSRWSSTACSTARGCNLHTPSPSADAYPMDNLPYTFTWTRGTLQYLYIGHYEPFDLWLPTLTTFNTNTATMNGEYLQLLDDGSASWGTLTLTDNSASGGKTLAQNGSITWTMPDDWVSGAHDGKERFWARFYVSTDLSSITMSNNTQHVQIGALNDVDDVIDDYAPTGWSLTFPTGQPSRIGTAQSQYWPRIHGVSVLRQLVSMSERSGEFFRFGGYDGGLDSVDWFRVGDRSSDMIASTGDPAAVMAAAKRAWIEDVRYSLDSSDLASEMIVEGAGQGEAALTLALATDTYVGWTVNTTDSRITKALALDHISIFRKFSSIGSSNGLESEEAANELLAAAIIELTELVQVKTDATLTLRGLSDHLRAGDEFTVDFADYDESGNLTYSMAGTYTALDVRWHLAASGVTATVNIANTARTVQRDRLLRMLEETLEQQRNVQPIDSSDVLRLGRTA